MSRPAAIEQLQTLGASIEVPVHLWHGEAFASLRRMLDPDANARYAARFLRDLRAETGSWLAAAGLYHSRTPALSAAYRARVADQLAALGESSAALSACSRAASGSCSATTSR